MTGYAYLLRARFSASFSCWVCFSQTSREQNIYLLNIRVKKHSSVQGHNKKNCYF